MNNSTPFRTWLPVFRPQTNLFSWNHTKKKSAQSSSVYCYCSPVMRGKNKKHTKKALTIPRWENCRVAETVVFLFLKALLKCICAWNQGPACSQFSCDFNSYSFLHPISDRCQLFECASLPSVLIPPSLSLSTYYFLFIYPTPYTSWVSNEFLREKRDHHWRMGTASGVNSTGLVGITHRYKPSFLASVTNSCTDNGKIFLCFCLLE